MVRPQPRGAKWAAAGSAASSHGPPPGTSPLGAVPRTTRPGCELPHGAEAGMASGEGRAGMDPRPAVADRGVGGLGTQPGRPRPPLPGTWQQDRQRSRPGPPAHTTTDHHPPAPRDHNSPNAQPRGPQGVVGLEESPPEGTALVTVGVSSCRSPFLTRGADPPPAPHSPYSCPVGQGREGAGRKWWGLGMDRGGGRRRPPCLLLGGRSALQICL